MKIQIARLYLWCLPVSALKKTNSAYSKLNCAYTLLQSIIMQEVLIAIFKRGARETRGRGENIRVFENLLTFEVEAVYIVTIPRAAKLPWVL